MSFYLWKYFLEDDVDGFRQYLARATYINSSSKQASASPAGISLKIGSPGTLATSPRTPTKPRRVASNVPTSSGIRNAGPVITRADINARDSSGRTILHHAASSRNDTATDFVKALLDVPTLDLYIQDSENGWTALHRALYAGNIEIAQAILARDVLNATDFSGQSRIQAGGLVKIKDHEGNSPFEVLRLTIAPRNLLDSIGDGGADPTDNDDVDSIDVRDETQDSDRTSRQVRSHIDLRGDEAFAFGSNKNLSLGLGDEDDRQFPERINLVRPDHLLWRLFEDHKAFRLRNAGLEDSASSIISIHQSDELPSTIRNKAIRIQNIVMAKLHTAVLTDDPVSNLHICGFGPGGRLGTGDETTRFSYICIQGGGLASRRVSSVALGQDHTVAICSSGEVFTWGSNKHGQLGYVLPEVSSNDTPTQLTPRQLYGLVKKETIIGAAASSIHSVIYTSTGLYTFGKNEGQLGLMDADARSLKMQDIPRRVGVSVLQSQIKAVSAIDRATTVLLESRDVIVFTHYGFTKVLFPFEESNILMSQALPTKYSKEANRICKITCGGNTIGALSTFGQVFTVDVPKPAEAVPSNVSTTNPNKARNALPLPNRVWSIKKSHMSAVDVAIGQDGSIILCTEAGAVWRKEKRAKIKSVHSKGMDSGRPKDYKFVRVPHLTRVIAVRSNAFGAFTAVRKDCDVLQEQLLIDPPKLGTNFFPLLSFHNYGGPRSASEDENAAEPELRFWRPPKREPSPALIKAAILKNLSAEDDFTHMSKRFEPLSETHYDVWIKSNVTPVRIPVHSTLLKARSKVLRSCLTEFHDKYYFSIPEVLSIEYGQKGEIELTFYKADFLTLVNFVLYLYAESLVDVWHYTSKALHLAPLYRQIRIELMKIASHLELRQLESAVRVMIDPASCMMEDFELAYMDLDFYTNADVTVDLAEGAERPAHSVVLSARCPFFEGLFHGRAAGMWLNSRKHMSTGTLEPTRVDLRHIDAGIFDIVLRHVYADTADELFDNIVNKDLDGFFDTVIEVMSVANELMLDRLVQVCQMVIGKFVTPRNVCGLLNTIAESSVDEFKNTALEYLCLNLEGMLEQRLLSDLDQYLLEELDETVKDNQLAFMPFVRSDRAQNELIERHPHLLDQLEKSRQRRIDSMRLQTRLVEEDIRSTSRIKVGSYDKYSSSPGSMRRMERPQFEIPSPRSSPAITPNEVGEDLPFDMDEDAIENQAASLTKVTPISARPSDNLMRLGSEELLTNVSESYPRSLDNQDNMPIEEFGRASKATGDPLPFESRISSFELPKAVWKQSVQHEDKADLKQIMEQASLSRVSNLTQAMKAGESSKTPVHRVSQKERKRQQQQSKTQTQPKRNQSEDTDSPQSPWAKVLPPKSNNLAFVSSEQLQADTKTSQPPQRPAMPTRQNLSDLTGPGKNVPADQKRTYSSSANTRSAAGVAPQIQSIRHTPLATRSASFVTAHTSMADILAQQQGEKSAIREAAAKRSLHDIQQEQEFQEWWDQESRRVQEEAARASSTSAVRNDKAGRGKGSRRRGSGRGGTSSAATGRDPKAPNQPFQAHSEDDDQSMRRSGESRGRGHGRGRGKGTSRQGQEARTNS